MKPAYGRTEPLVCEGFYDRNVSQPFIEVVSALLQPASSLRNLDAERLSLTPRVVPRKPMTLRVQPLPVDTLYRVDARIDRGQVRWTPAKMLENTRLQLPEIGFLAVATPRKGNELAVVPLSADSASPSAASPPAPGSVYITIRVSTEISKLNWRVFPTARATDENLEWRNAIEGRRLYRWASFPLEVPLTADGKSATLELSPFDKKGQPLQAFAVVIAGTDYERP